jgi:hypothetical protein
MLSRANLGLRVTKNAALVLRRHFETSPYAVLGVEKHNTKAEIKARFRKLAKLCHPDLNQGVANEDLPYQMSALIEAYELLMADDFNSQVYDSRVALDCEIYSIEELCQHRLYNVYALKIALEDEDGTYCAGTVSTLDETVGRETEDGLAVYLGDIYDTEAHPLDSVSDLKRQLQRMHAVGWELEGRRKDRDGVATGWELVHDDVLLSYHLFLQDYGVREGDTIFAVVRKYSET